VPNAAPDQPAPPALLLESCAERLKTDVLRLTGATADSALRLGVAVSGGPDSMALLALAHRSFSGCVEAATVDHGLRGESAQEAQMVARYCEQVGITHRILLPSTPIIGSVQAAARSVRYALLEAWRTERGLDWIMTAHHADDQAETLLMRLNRASGVGGLAGVRARNGVIVRPVLGWRRRELAAVVAALTLPHVQDPSNSNPRFDRVVMRNNLADADWIDVDALGKSAQALAEAEAALQWMVAQVTQDHLFAEADGAFTLDKIDYPPEILRRLLLHMIACAAPDQTVPRGEALDHALTQLGQGKKAHIGNLLIIGGKKWVVRAAPPRRNSRLR
jgi:tRNA(Ile)-lysidine synthase